MPNWHTQSPLASRVVVGRNRPSSLHSSLVSASGVALAAALLLCLSCAGGAPSGEGEFDQGQRETGPQQAENGNVGEPIDDTSDGPSVPRLIFRGLQTQHQQAEGGSGGEPTDERWPRILFNGVHTGPQQVLNGNSGRSITDTSDETPIIRIIRLYYVGQPSRVVKQIDPAREKLAPNTIIVSLPPTAEDVYGEVYKQVTQFLPQGQSGVGTSDTQLSDVAQLRQAPRVSPESLAADFQLLTAALSADKQPLPMVVVCGPKAEVQCIERLITAIDIPKPEVRLDIWVFQLSGGNAHQVSERSRRVRDYVRVASRLLEGYLRQLEICALEELFKNQRLPRRGHSGRETETGDRATTETPLGGHVATPAQKSRPRQIPEGSMVLVPSSRGIHPLSVTEMLAVLLMATPDPTQDSGAQWSQFIAERLSGQIAGWLNRLCSRDPAGARAWLELLQQSPHNAAPTAARLLQQQLDGRAAEIDSEDVTLLLPQRFLQAFAEETYHKAARGAVENLVRARQALSDGPAGLPARDSRLLAADGRTTLHTAERALSDDLHRLFLGPLISTLHGTAARGAGGGKGLASKTNITVVSGQPGLVRSRTISYFDVSRPRQQFTLSRATQADPVAASQLSDLLDDWGVTSTQNERIWEVVTDGAVLCFVPHVLAGGSGADIDIELIVSRPTSHFESANRATRAAPVPLSRVATHRAHTSIYVDSLDLFGLSSLSLTTSHPRPDFETPILSHLPLLGDMFTFKRGARSVHHESIMLVYATILPTGADLAELIDVSKR